MIVLDANVFLRALIEPVEPYNRWMFDEASALLRRAAAGEVDLCTSSAVVAEVAFLLTSRNVYAMSVDDAVARLEPVLGIPNLVIDRKADVLRALHVWSGRPAMGFVDALLVAMAESLDAPLATFDTGFSRFGTIGRHVWRAEPSD